MTTERPADLTSLIEQVIEAYNAQDYERYAKYFAHDLYFCYHNHGIEFTERQQLVDALRKWATDLVPDRRLGEPTRVLATGNVVIREQAWSGTAIADVPGVAQKDASVSVDLCSIYVFDGELISQWHDYG